MTCWPAMVAARRIAAVAVASCALAAAGAGAEARRHSCAFSGLKILASDAAGRVFVSRTAGSGGVGDDWYAACLYADGVARLLTQTAPDSFTYNEIEALRMAGRYVAIGERTSSNGSDAESDELDVYDVHRGFFERLRGPLRYHGGAIKLHSVTATGTPWDPSIRQDFRSLVLAPSGSVAWIGNSETARYEVHAVARDGRDQVLDSGSAIKPGSLRLAGTALTWSHGGAIRSVPFR